MKQQVVTGWAVLDRADGVLFSDEATRQFLLYDTRKAAREEAKSGGLPVKVDVTVTQI